MPRHIYVYPPMTSDDRDALDLWRQRAITEHQRKQAEMRARIIELSGMGESVQRIVALLGSQSCPVHAATVRMWIKRYNRGGIDALDDRRRSGRPKMYDDDER